MGIKTFRPITPSRRNMTSLTNDEITKSTPEKSLLMSFNKKFKPKNIVSPWIRYLYFL